MIDESVRFLDGAGQARGVRRRALLRRLARRPRVRAALRDRGRRGGRGGRLPVRHQRGVAAAVRRGRRPRGHGGAPRRVVGIHAHNDSDCAVASSLVAVERRRAPGAGHHQRLRRALRQRQPRQHHPGAQAQDGLRRRERRAARAPHRDLALRRRRGQRGRVERTRPTWAAPPSPTRAACTWPPSRRRPQTFEHVDPEKVGNEQRIVVSELSGKGAVVRKAQELGLRLEGDDARVATVLKRLKAREHEGYHYEAADASFDLLLRQELAPHEPLFRLESFRVIVEKREDGQRRGRGDDQDPRGRRAHHQHRRGQRPGQRPGLGAAPGDREQVPAPRRHRAGQLQGAHPRRDQGHRRRHPRAARRQRRGGELGQHRRERERRRGELGGAGRLDRVRDAARPRATTAANDAEGDGR